MMMFSLSATTVAISFFCEPKLIRFIVVVIHNYRSSFFYWFVRKKKKHIRYCNALRKRLFWLFIIFFFCFNFFSNWAPFISVCVCIPVLKIHKEIHFEIDLFFCYHLPLLLLISVIVVVKIQKTDWRLQAIFFVLFIRNIKKKSFTFIIFKKQQQVLNI